MPMTDFNCCVPPTRTIPFAYYATIKQAANERNIILDQQISDKAKQILLLEEEIKKLNNLKNKEYED